LGRYADVGRVEAFDVDDALVVRKMALDDLDDIVRALLALASVVAMTPTRRQPLSRKYRTDAISMYSVLIYPANEKLPAAGCIAGERQYCTGPFATSGAIARHAATVPPPRMTVGYSPAPSR